MSRYRVSFFRADIEVEAASSRDAVAKAIDRQERLARVDVRSVAELIPQPLLSHTVDAAEWATDDLPTAAPMVAK